MDLYNDEVGRNIALQHPTATIGEIEDLIRQSVDQGDTVVIDKAGNLQFSSDLRPGQTGHPEDTFFLGGNHAMDPAGTGQFWSGGYNPGGAPSTSGTTTSGQGY